eukprot:2705777-Amphidinium_carterae.1
MLSNEVRGPIQKQPDGSYPLLEPMRSALKSSRVEAILQHLPKPAAVSSASSSNTDDPLQALIKQVSTLREEVRQVRSQPNMSKGQGKKKGGR